MTSPLDVIARAAELPPEVVRLDEERSRRRKRGAVKDEGATFERGDHVELAEHYAAMLNKGVHDEGATYQYDDARGVFVALDRSEEARRVMAFAGKPVTNKGPLKLHEPDVRGVTKLASDLLARPGFFREAAPGLAFADGFVRVDADGARLVAHSPEHRARHGYPFPFVGPAEPVRFLAMLRSCWRDDADADAKIALLQEFGGACLFGLATRFQRALLLYGPGGDGKSQVLEVLKAIMPPSSVRAIPPQELGDKFARVKLAGALLNAVGDIPAGPVLDSGYLKAVVTGDEIEAQEKHRPQVKFCPRAGHAFATNRLLAVSDTSPGFWRRWVVLTFARSFEGAHAKPEDVAARVLDYGAMVAREELPEVVRWFAAGAVRLVARGCYDVPQSSVEALAAWRGEASSAALFVGDATRPAKGAERTQAKFLYASYASWCEANGHRLPVTSHAFGRALRDMGVEGRKSDGRMVYPLVILNGTNGEPAM